MRHRPTYLLFLLWLVPAGVRGQSTSGGDYFPLEVGNTWTYMQVLHPPGAPPDTIWTGVYTIGEAVSVGDTLYHVARHPFALADTLRADGSGRIWARSRGREALLFDFTLADEDAYQYHVQDLTYQVTVAHRDTVRVGAGRFTDVVVLSFDDPQWIDEEHAFAFARGVGIIYAYGSHGDYLELHTAEVAGRVITSIDDRGAPVRSIKPFVYPNPAQDRVVVVFPAVGLREPSVAVYDVRGRFVETLLPDRCNGTACVYSCALSHLPHGVYFARSVHGRGVHTARIVVVR